MRRICSLNLFEKDFKLLDSLSAFGKPLHILGPENFINRWKTPNLYAGDMYWLLLLVEVRLDLD